MTLWQSVGALLAKAVTARVLRRWGFRKVLLVTVTVAYADVPLARTSAASTLATVTQQVGLSFGISFGGIVLHLATGGGARSPPIASSFHTVRLAQ